MNILHITLIVIPITLLANGIFTFLLKESFKAYVSNAIKHEFDQKLEEYKSKELKRQKAALIAELISEWISKPDNYKRLNQLTFEAFIWLPKETSIRLSNLLSHGKDCPNTREILGEARELILGQEEKIDPNLIIVFEKN